MMMKIKILLTVLLLTQVGCTTTRISKHNALNTKFQSCLDNELTETMPGILVNITSPGKNIFWSGASGLSDRESREKLLPNQTFRIASVTKTFVAATVLRLWEDKRLSLEDPISKYISQEHIGLLKAGGYDPDKITIRHLLTHSSGMAEHVNSPKFKVDFMKTHHVWTRTETIQDLNIYSKPVGPVGQQFSYSDTGYVLLGEMIETITGKSMGEAIVDELQLRKLGIKNTYMEDFNGDFTGKRIHQYFENADTYRFHPSMDYYGGGGLLSTTEDLSRFFLSLFQHKVFRYKSTLDRMLTSVEYKTPQSMDYRMGIWKIEINGMEAYTHSGFWGTQVVYIPSINTAVSANYSQRWTKKGVAPVIPNLLGIIENNRIES